MLHDFIHFIRLSRPLNVLIAGLVFGYSSFLALQKNFDFLSKKEFWIAFGAISMITATGYWVNDVFDFKIDRINKPGKTIVNAHLSAKKVFTAYFSLLFLVLGASWFLQPITLFFLNFCTVFLLFAYAAWFKRFSVLGNLLIAALTGMVIYYAGLLYHFHLSMVWMTMFAFGLTFLREVTKDVEDIRGDLKFKLQTLPIRIGIRGTRKFLFVCYGLFLLSCYLPFAEEGLRTGHLNWTYLGVSIALVQMPMLYNAWVLSHSYKPGDFRIQSFFLKLLILPGMATVYFLR